jgi:hypothetical protein
MRAVVPHTPAGAQMQAFTAFCGACGGVQLVSARAEGAGPGSAPPAPPTKKRWWQFWK